MKRIRHSKLMKNKDYPVIALALFALAGVPDLSLVQADQLTRLTDFGVPRSSNPTRLVDVNGTLFFFVPTDSGNGGRYLDVVALRWPSGGSRAVRRARHRPGQGGSAHRAMVRRSCRGDRLRSDRSLAKARLIAGSRPVT